MPTYSTTDIYNNPKLPEYYFGIGGLGDLILLLASFYDDIYYQDKIKNKRLIFWANNPAMIKTVLGEFPKLISLVTSNPLKTVTDRQKLHKQYQDVVVSRNFCGSGHIPMDLKYSEEWQKIHNVFSYYNIPESVNFYRDIFDKRFKHNNLCGKTFEPKEYVVVQPYSFGIEPFKKRYIKKDNIISIINKHGINKTVFIGSESDLKYLRDEGINFKLSTTDILDAMALVCFAQELHATDSWAKTLSGLCNVATYYYVSEKVGDYKQMFGVNYDPSDNVFLKNWGFNIINQHDYDLSYLGNGNKYLGESI